MKYIVILGALFLILFWFIYQQSKDETPSPFVIDDSPSSELVWVNEPAIGLEFSYRGGESGYVREDIAAEQSESEYLVKGIMLTLKSDWVELHNSTEPRDGPPMIQVRVYRNDEGLEVYDWIHTHSRESNIALALTPPSPTMIDGIDGLTYRTDGLYATDVYVVVTNGLAYLFMGAESTDDAPQTRDLRHIVSSATFHEIE